MGIKKSVAIVAEITGTKASRLAAMAAEQRAERLLREDETRPATHKVKRGKQGLPGRTRVERARCEVEEVETSRTVREIYAEMMDIIREMQQFAAENPPAWIRWEMDRYGRGLVVMGSPWDNIPCPICATYPITEEGLAQLKEDSGWMA